MMATEQPVSPDKLEVRRTGPELREEIRQYLVAKIGDIFNDLDYGAIEILLQEMQRRSPKYEVARRRDADPDPETILAIRKYKGENPSVSYKDMSSQDLFNTSTRCISFALVGRRDGSPVYDDSGRRIKRPRKPRATALRFPLTPEPWE